MEREMTIAPSADDAFYILQNDAKNSDQEDGGGQAHENAFNRAWVNIRTSHDNGRTPHGSFLADSKREHPRYFIYIRGCPVIYEVRNMEIIIIDINLDS